MRAENKKKDVEELNKNYKDIEERREKMAAAAKEANGAVEVRRNMEQVERDKSIKIKGSL